MLEKNRAESLKALDRALGKTQGLLVTRHFDAYSRDTDDLLWVEALMEFDFTDETGRDIEVTKSDLNNIVENFNAQVVGRKVFVDVDHMAEFAVSDDPKSRARIGTVEKLALGTSRNEFTKGAPTLLAGVRLNKRGKEAVDGDEYGYVSVVIHRKWKDRRPGKDELCNGPVLTSITLTNDPFVPWLEPVGEDVRDRIAASRKSIVVTSNISGSTEKVSSDKFKRFVLDTVRNALTQGTSLEDLRNTLQAELHKKLGLSEDEYCWIQDLQVATDTTGMAIYEHASKVMGIDYTLNEDGSVTWGDTYEVEHPWIKKGQTQDQDNDEDQNGSDKDSDATNREGQGVTMDQDKIDALTRERDEEKAKREKLEAEALEREKEAEQIRKETLRLRKQSLSAKFDRVITALKRPNSKGRVLPPAILKRYKQLVKQYCALTAEKEDEKITLQSSIDDAAPAADAPGEAKELAEAVAEVGQEIATQAESTAEAIAVDSSKPEEVKEAQVGALLVEVATELDKIKELETVEPKAETVGASRKPVETEGKTDDDLLAERQSEILKRKPDEVPELAKCKNAFQRTSAALRLARKELVRENLIKE